jgi:hypothetical protein
LRRKGFKRQEDFSFGADLRFFGAYDLDVTMPNNQSEKDPAKPTKPSDKKPTGPSYATADDAPESKQIPVDPTEEASMESFPASDPPGSGAAHV